MLAKYLNSKKKSEWIIMPPNPIVEVFQEFLTSEALASLFCFAFTVAFTFLMNSKFGHSVENFLQGWGVSLSLAFALVGPVFEKLAFFIQPYFKVKKEFVFANGQKDLKWKCYWKIIRLGSLTLIWDILVHDTTYVKLMLVCQAHWPEVPPLIFFFMSFFVAAVIVAMLMYVIMELLYLRFVWSLNDFSDFVPLIELKRKILNATRKFQNRKWWGKLRENILQMMKKIDFNSEKYYEARVRFETIGQARKVFDYLVEKYKLGTVVQDPKLEKGYQVVSGKIMEGDYEDVYYDVHIFEFNHRIVRIRVRFRDSEGRLTKNVSVQVVVTRANRLARREISQHCYYVIKKSKWYHKLDVDELVALCDIDPKLYSRLIRVIGSDRTKGVRTRRLAAQDPDKMFVSLDDFSGGPVIEIKSYPRSVELFKSAMAYAMNHEGALTTLGKDELMEKDISSATGRSRLICTC